MPGEHDNHRGLTHRARNGRRRLLAVSSRLVKLAQSYLSRALAGRLLELGGDSNETSIEHDEELVRAAEPEAVENNLRGEGQLVGVDVGRCDHRPVPASSAPLADS